MELQIFSIKDRAVTCYLRPWPAHTAGEAIRVFSDEINNPNGVMNKHADDYDLFHVGKFEDTTGELTPFPGGPVQLALGKQLKIT